jgi:hypothetical protein
MMIGTFERRGGSPALPQTAYPRIARASHRAAFSSFQPAELFARLVALGLSKAPILTTPLSVAQSLRRGLCG